MKLVITGTPGSGKSTLAESLGKKLKMQVINEKDFALKNSIGKFNKENELEIPVKEFEKKANAFLKKHDNVIFEGHILCEMKLKSDKIIVLSINPEDLEARLSQRSYSAEKIMDNVFCEGIEYCKKYAKRNYSAKKTILLISKADPLLTLAEALYALTK